MSHVTHMNESCHTYELVMPRTHEWVMIHMWMSHVTYMNESCHTYEWVVSCICDMAHLYRYEMEILKDNCVTSRDMTYLYNVRGIIHWYRFDIWAIMLPCVSWLTYTMYVTWLMYTMYGHDSFIQSTWHDSLRQIWNRDILRQLCYRVCHDSFIHCMDMTHSYNVLEITQ